jgi:hypothetical protein
MGGASASAIPAPARHDVPAAAELLLVARAAGRLVALDAGLVERTVDAAEGAAEPLPHEDLPPGGLVALTLDGERCAGWDLGALLGATPATRAWILLRFRAGGQVLPLALGVAACLSVARAVPGAQLALPAGALPRRPGALARVLPTAGMGGAPRDAAPLCFALDLGALWSADELRRSALVAHGRETRP